MDLDVSVPSGPADLEALAGILTRSLGVPPERTPTWLERVGAPHVRIARRGGAVVGGLGLLPMGHWLGGRSVPCTGVTAVAVAPEHRSRGVGAEMMRTALEEMHQAGVALSSLYPATYPLYRAAGYESAANRFVYSVPLANLGPGAREPEMREATPDEHGVLRTLYEERARTTAGLVDRSRYFWMRIHEPFGEEARAYLVVGEGGPEGYVVVWYKPGTSPLAANELGVRDVVVRTPAAARRVLRFLGDHRSVARTVSFVAGPGDPLLLLAREERVQITDVQRCMVRIVDVRLALRSRGWSPSVRGEVHFAVQDALLRDNARRIVLEVAGGRAEVREGGAGAIGIDVRGLAALYTGFLGGHELRAAGLCDGDDAHLAAATALFAGPAPWVQDHF